MIWVLPQVAFRAKGRAWNTDYRKEWRCRWSGFPITRSVLFDRRRRHSFTAKMTLKAVQIPIGNNTTNPAIPIIHRPKDRKPRRRKNSTILVSTSILSGTDLRGIGVAWLTYWTVAFALDGLQTLRLVENGRARTRCAAPYFHRSHAHHRFVSVCLYASRNNKNSARSARGGNHGGLDGTGQEEELEVATGANCGGGYERWGTISPSLLRGHDLNAWVCQMCQFRPVFKKKKVL